MPFDRTQPSFIQLDRLIREGQHRVVPFVGAGLSVYGPAEERLPLWSELIFKLRERAQSYGLISEHDSRIVDDLIRSSHLIEATDKLLDLLGEKQFRSFIEQTLDISGKPIPPAILELVCISWSLIVTTNIDEFVEKAWLTKHGSPLEVATHADVTRLTQAISGNIAGQNSILAKLHGTVTRYETWILSRAHYTFLTERNIAYAETLKNLLLRTVFFIGYGINDDDLQTVLDYISSIYPAGAGSYFALLDSRLKGTPRTNSLLVEYGMQPIWFRFNPSTKGESSGGYEEVLECIQLLVGAWTRHRSKISVVLKYFPELDPDFVGREAELDDIASAILSPQPQSIQIVGFGGEGKTSLVQKFLEEYREQLAESSFQSVFGCSFYRADAGRFINDAYYALCPGAKAIDIGSKVAELVQLFFAVPILLIADGAEVLQGDSGEITNPYLSEIFSAAVEGKSVVLVTTRLSLPYPNMARLQLGPLSYSDASRLLKNWGLDYSKALTDSIREKVGRHALSLRIFAGLARSQPASASRLLQNLSLSTVPDEADPLRANKATRILTYYDEHLDDNGHVFMRCFSLLRRPTSLSTILAVFAKPCGSNALNAPLLDIDLRPIIQDLLHRRLLIVESGSLLTTHPLVREHFYAAADAGKATILHRSLAQHHLSMAGDMVPRTFDECLPLLDACYHAARASDWSMFHYIFFHKLNREHENFLGNTLGAWEEFLDMVKLAFPKGESDEPIVEPAYYKSAAARALKHLGKSEEAKRQYVACIATCARTREPETSRYINNFLSLSISMGDLRRAKLLAPLNLATLKWIDTEWRRLWQTEFALFSIGFLAALLGDGTASLEFCSAAEHVWDPLGERRLWFFDYYRVYYSDILLAEGRLEEAHVVTERSLAIGREHGWKETIGVALRSMSSIHRMRYLDSNLADSDRHYSLHLEFLRDARVQAEALRIPRVEVETLLEEVRGHVALFLKQQALPRDLSSVNRTVRRLEEVIHACRYRLYIPELQSAIAWTHLFRGNKNEAVECAKSALISARGISNLLAIKNQAWLLQPLLMFLGLGVPMAVTNSQFPPLDEMLAMDIDELILLERLALLDFDNG